MRHVAVFVINIYQFFSRMGPKVCRFHPSCSEYTKQAILKYGFIRGSWMGLKRLFRCNPWSPGGFDPVE
jgi:putative membrane protein insertion efficiency factor